MKLEDAKMFGDNKEKIIKSCNQTDNLLMKPFALGWTREVVNRVITKNRNLNCDIYYFTPSGKKIRSLTEIRANCKSFSLILLYCSEIYQNK